MMMDNLLQNIKSCTRCELRKDCHQVSVNNPYKADLFIIVDSANKDDCIVGEPLVGNTGVLLKKYLKSLNINNYYITHAVKCHSNKFRPKSQHIQTCGKWLDKEIEVVNPKCIVTFGKTPLMHLLSAYTAVSLKKYLTNKIKTKYNLYAYPWYDLQWLLSRGKYYDELTLKFLKGVIKDAKLA